MVNLELYKVFYTVAKCGSLTKAAEELYISQPAVSQAIKQLEKQMTELEEKQAQLQEQMALPQIVSDYSKLSVVMEELNQVEATYEQICLEWEQLID